MKQTKDPHPFKRLALVALLTLAAIQMGCTTLAPHGTTTATPADTPMTPQDLQNARAIWAADPTPWGPVGVNCIDKLSLHWPDVQALFAPLSAFHPAAEIVGPASGLAALFVGADTLQADAAKRLAIVQAGLPMDVVVACSPIVLKPGELAARLGIRVPKAVHP